MTFPRLSTGVLAAGLLCALLAGCRGPIPAVRYPPPPSETIQYRRVAIVGFFERSPYGGTAEQFTNALRDKLAEYTVGSDVIVIPAESLPFEADPFVGGAINVDVLVQARDRHLADALVVGSVDQHDPYHPPSLHVSLKVIDTATAAIPFELSDGWDASERRIRDGITGYYYRHLGSDDCRFGPDIFLIAPRYFMRFVAADVAERMTAVL